MEDKTSTMGRRTFLKTAAASYTASVHVPQMYHVRDVAPTPSDCFVPTVHRRKGA